MDFAEKIYRHFYARRKRDAESRRVAFGEVCVVSVGNLTTGGTGKTPAVQWLARRFQKAGRKTVIVGRGYGGEYSARGAVVSDGNSIALSASQSGDEALLHARALNASALHNGGANTPVIIGRDRVAAVKLAIEKFAPNVVILDDGFQYWSLARNFDLVLLDARRPFGNRKLLPTGRLREPAKELKRADAIVLTRTNAAAASELQATKNLVREYSSAPIFLAQHAPATARDEANGVALSSEILNGKRIAALSALADNENFFGSLKSRGTQVVSTLGRRDHHAWKENEIRKFVTEAQRKGATALVTTEKDAVKIAPPWAAPLPLWSLAITMEIEDESALWQLIDECCETGRRTLES